MTQTPRVAECPPSAIILIALLLSKTILPRSLNHIPLISFPLPPPQRLWDIRKLSTENRRDIRRRKREGRASHLADCCGGLPGWICSDPCSCCRRVLQNSDADAVLSIKRRVSGMNHRIPQLQPQSMLVRAVCPVHVCLVGNSIDAPSHYPSELQYFS